MWRFKVTLNYIYIQWVQTFCLSFFVSNHDILHCVFHLVSCEIEIYYSKYCKLWKKLCYRFASTSLPPSQLLNYLVPLAIRVPNYCDNQYAENVNFKRTEEVHKNIGEISCAWKVISCALYKEIWKYLMSYTTVQLNIAVMNNFDSALNSEHCALLL